MEYEQLLGAVAVVVITSPAWSAITSTLGESKSAGMKATVAVALALQTEGDPEIVAGSKLLDVPVAETFVYSIDVILKDCLTLGLFQLL